MPVIFVLFFLSFFQIILEFPFFGQGTFDFNYNLITLLHAITSQQVEFFGKVKTKNWDLWRVVFYIMTNGKRKKLKITFKKCFIDQMIFLFSFKDLMSLFGMILQVYYYQSQIFSMTSLCETSITFMSIEKLVLFMPHH